MDEIAMNADLTDLLDWQDPDPQVCSWCDSNADFLVEAAGCSCARLLPRHLCERHAAKYRVGGPARHVVCGGLLTVTRKEPL
jgi:hypothetical protein